MKLEPIQVLQCKHGRKRGASLVTLFPDTTPQPGTSMASMRQVQVRLRKGKKLSQRRTVLTNMRLQVQDPRVLLMASVRWFVQVRRREILSGFVRGWEGDWNEATGVSTEGL